jgi:hypothetical protein
MVWSQDVVVFVGLIPGSPEGVPPEESGRPDNLWLWTCNSSPRSPFSTKGASALAENWEALVLSFADEIQ